MALCCFDLVARLLKRCMLRVTVLYLQFDRERIPERVVHARGASAKGFFEARLLLSLLHLNLLSAASKPFHLGKHVWLTWSR